MVLAKLRINLWQLMKTGKQVRADSPTLKVFPGIGVLSWSPETLMLSMERCQGVLELEWGQGTYIFIFTHLYLKETIFFYCEYRWEFHRTCAFDTIRYPSSLIIKLSIVESTM